MYRLRYDLFVFLRETSQSQFSGSGELVAELMDSTETSVARHFRTLTLQSDDNLLPTLRRHFAEGVLTFNAPPGKYTVAWSIEDGQSHREVFSRKQPLIVLRSPAGTLVRSSLLLVNEASPSVTAVFHPTNLENGIMLGQNAGLLFALRNNPQISTLSISLQRRDNDDEKTVVLRDTAVAFHIFANQSLSLGDSTGFGITAGIRDGNSSLVFVSLPSAQWNQGHYVLTVRLHGRDSATVTQDLSIRWPQMPQSLTDLDFAIAAMKYYLTEDDYDELRSGGRATRIRKFEEFWKKKDPTPATAYNEAMAEYFRRVDIAFVQFRTIKND
ncbi:MAG: GWxTD domain-containing protein, partial [Ignavibacteriales bacterium]|nr:GWxTD domain-containing protein [Ignavibacteriales bacterium]